MQAIMPAILLVICFDMIRANEIPEDILNYEPEILIESTYKSSRYVRKPSCASHDRFGNIMLNGQMHNDAIAPFSFHSTLHEESEFSMVFCLRGEDTDEQLMCDKNGLVVCFHSYNDEFPTENLTEIPQYLAHQCKEMNGFMVKTENRAFFRIDTRYGNTYLVPIPINQCIAMWFTYDIAMNKTTFDTFGDIKVNALSTGNPDSDMNETADPLEYDNSWVHAAFDKDDRPLSMLWKEVIVKPAIKGNNSVVHMTAVGGGICCALTARLTGMHISKCYFKWRALDGACLASYPGHAVECDYPYSTGHNVSKTELFKHISQEGFDRDVQAYLHDITGNFTHIFVDRDLVNDAFSDTLRNFTNTTWQPEIVHDNLNLSGVIEAEVGIEAGSVLSLKIEGEVAVKYYDTVHQEFNESIAIANSKQFKDAFNAILKKKLNDKLKNDTARANMTTFYLGGYWNSSYDFSKTNSRYRFETHSVRNFVKYPDELVMKRLHYICMGYDIPLNVFDGFTNNDEFVERALRKEQELGYPNYGEEIFCKL